VDFRFDDDARGLFRSAHDSLERYLPVSRLRADRDFGEGWRQVARDGWLHAGLPVSAGGGELPLPLVCGIAREAGELIAGDGFVSNAVLIPTILTGTADADNLLAAAVDRPGVLVADGRPAWVTPDGQDEQAWCFGAEPGLWAYRVRDQELQVFAPESWSFEPLAGLGVTTGTIRVTGTPDVVSPLTRSSNLVPDEARLVHAATLIGSSSRVLTDLVAYVKTRHQFGEPLGTFQAIQHGLATLHLRIEVAWAAVAYAALQPTEVDIATARLHTRGTARLADQLLTQYFGGISMTWEHDAHLYLKTSRLGQSRFSAAGTPAVAPTRRSEVRA
jgi:alkylation response protein AidB-like acyl-CoA dehydrogenase